MTLVCRYALGKRHSWVESMGKLPVDITDCQQREERFHVTMHAASYNEGKLNLPGALRKPVLGEMFGHNRLRS